MHQEGYYTSLGVLEYKEKWNEAEGIFEAIPRSFTNHKDDKRILDQITSNLSQ